MIIKKQANIDAKNGYVTLFWTRATDRGCITLNEAEALIEAIRRDVKALKPKLEAYAFDLGEVTLTEGESGFYGQLNATLAQTARPNFNARTAELVADCLCGFEVQR